MASNPRRWVYTPETTPWHILDSVPPNEPSVAGGDTRCDLTAEQRATLVRRIRERREALGITRCALSARLGTNWGQVVEWYETGRQVPKATTRRRLAEVLKTSVEWLVGDE